MKRRATELLPQVLLTLLSIIQAIALELVWSRIFASDYLFGGGLVAVVGWLQFSAIALGIVLIWLVYTGLVLRFVWVPRTRDSIFPFAIGVLEFSLIESTGPDHAALWLACMALAFAMTNYVSNDIFVHASRERGDEMDGDDDSVRNRRAGRVIAALLLVFAAGVAWSGGFGMFAMFSYAVVNLLLLGQMRTVHVYLAQALAEADEPAAPEDR